MDGRNHNNEGLDPSDENPLSRQELDAYDERLYKLFVRVYRMAQIAHDFRDSCEEMGEEIENTLETYRGCMQSLTKTLMRERRNLNNAEHKRKVQ